MLIITSPMFHSKILGYSNGYTINISAIPQRLKQRIGKTKGQNVLDCFLSKIVIDPECLRFGKTIMQNLIDFPGGINIMTYRFFHDNSGPLPVRCHSFLLKMLWNLFEHCRRSSHIKDQL
jgi:hypothetical protein